METHEITVHKKLKPRIIKLCHLLYGLHAFLLAVDFWNIASSASTALLAEEIACELMAEESDPLGFGKPSFGIK